jgi:glycogen operon protein
VDWRLTPRQQELLRYAKQLVAIRRANPVLRRRSFFGGRSSSDGAKDVTWLRADGAEMTEADWQDAKNHVLGMMIEGSAADETDARGRPVEGSTLLLAINGGASECSLQLPLRDGTGAWYEIVHTASSGRRVLRGEALHLAAHSLVLLRFDKARRTGRQRAHGAEPR